MEMEHGGEGMIGGPWGMAEEAGPRTWTMYPSATGGSMVAIKFDGGVAILADRVASYGKMARYKNMPRIRQLGPSTIVALGGDVADYQFLQSRMEEILQQRQVLDADAAFPANQLHAWLNAVLYNRRTKMNPIWNTALVLGMVSEGFGKEQVPFLGEVNMRGVPNTGSFIATGFATYLCRQALEEAYQGCKKTGKELTEAQALEVLQKCQAVLFYRDCNSYPDFDIGIVSKDGVRMVEKQSVKGDWANLAHLSRGYE